MCMCSTSLAAAASPKKMVWPWDSRKRLSKRSKTSLHGWWIDAITVRPSRDKFFKVVMTKKAEALWCASQQKNQLHNISTTSSWFPILLFESSSFSLSRICSMDIHDPQKTWLSSRFINMVLRVPSWSLPSRTVIFKTLLMILMNWWFSISQRGATCLQWGHLHLSNFIS